MFVKISTSAAPDDESNLKKKDPTRRADSDQQKEKERPAGIPVHQ
jgi:hypothetical protein